MSFGSRDIALDAVRGLIAEELGRFGSLKEAARSIKVTPQTIANIRDGAPPSAAVLVRAISRFGLKILEPIIGPADPAYHLAKLAEIEQTLKDIRYGIRSAAGTAPEGRNVEGRGKGPRLADGASWPLGGSGGPEGGGMAGEGPADRPALALVTARRSLDLLAGGTCAPLREHLSLWKARPSLSLTEAVEIAKADPLQTTGVAFKADHWTLAHVASKNVMHSNPASMVGRAVAQSDDPAYGQRLIGEFDQAANDDQPHLLDSAVSLIRGDGVKTASGRIIRCVFKDGNRPVLMSRFIRFEAAA